MLSSNQILEISGSLFQIEAVLEFVLEYSGEKKNMYPDEIKRGCKLVYQITEDGKYCIGWGFGEVPQGWTEYQFQFDIPIVSAIIKQHIESLDMRFNPNEDYGDGSCGKGFLMKCNPSYDDRRAIKNNWYLIAYFEPFVCFYHK